MEVLKRKYPEAEIQLWSEDEQTLEDSLTLRYRLGLKPVLRRVYVPEGENPIANRSAEALLARYRERFGEFSEE